jgi:hypothetical protein
VRKNWAQFFAQVLPLLSSLGREMFESYQGDDDAAKLELEQLIEGYRLRRRQGVPP